MEDIASIEILVFNNNRLDITQQVNHDIFFWISLYVARINLYAAYGLVPEQMTYERRKIVLYKNAYHLTRKLLFT